MFRRKPTKMLVGAGEGPCACKGRSAAGAVSHSPDRGPMAPHPFGPSFPNLLASLSKSLPASRGWWQEAKGRLFEIAELLGEREAILMAEALPTLVRYLHEEPGPRGENLRDMAHRLGTPREDLAMLAADKVTGMLRVGSVGHAAPPVPGAVLPSTPPRPGFLFSVDGALQRVDPASVRAMTGGIFPAGQIARGVLVRHPEALRYVAGATALARRGSPMHQEIVGAIGSAMKHQIRSSYVAHYKALSRSIARARAFSAGAHGTAEQSYERAMGGRIAYLEAGDIE